MINASYYPLYNMSTYPPSTIDCTILNNMLIGFIPFSSSGSIDHNHADMITYATYKTQLFNFKITNPSLKMYCSFPGAAGSPNFTTLLQHPNKVNTMIADLTTLVADGFDGINVDYEAFTSTDYTNYLSFIQQLHAAFPTKIISTAIAVEELRYMTKEFFNYVDYVYLMTYAFNVSNTRCIHQQSIYLGLNSYETVSCDVYVNNLLAYDVPRSKIIIGYSLYAKRYYGSTGYLGTASSNDTTNVLLYKNITEQQQLSAIYDQASCSSYYYQNGTFFSFDTHLTLQHRINYVKELGLAGIFSWYLSIDYPSSNRFCYTKYLNNNI
jgi:chitinase